MLAPILAALAAFGLTAGGLVVKSNAMATLWELGEDRTNPHDATRDLNAFCQLELIAHVLCALADSGAARHRAWLAPLLRGGGGCCAVMVGGFRATARSVAELGPAAWAAGSASVDVALQRIRGVASLHVFGEADTRVRPALSRDLAACFAEGAQVIVHPKAHVVPQRAADLAAFVRFFASQQEERSSRKHKLLHL